MPIVVALALSGVLPGCGSSPIGGTAVGGSNNSEIPSTTSIGAASFNSCTALTSEDVKSLGLDPSTKTNADLGNSGDVASGCAWKSDVALVSISVGSQTVGDYLRRTDLGPVRSQQIGARKAAVLSTDATRDCGVALDSSPVAVLVNIAIKFQSIGAAGDPCGIAIAIATKLAPLLPQ